MTTSAAGSDMTDVQPALCAGLVPSYDTSATLQSLIRLTSLKYGRLKVNTAIVVSLTRLSTYLTIFILHVGLQYFLNVLDGFVPSAHQN